MPSTDSSGPARPHVHGTNTTIGETYLSQIPTNRSGRLAFRGHADISWPLHSGATRRLLRELHTESPADDPRSLTFGKLYLSYHRSVLLEPARTYEFDNSSADRDTDLQLLSKLQHLGAATGLIDFTLDSLVALWFATAAPESKRCAGKVIVVDLGNTLDFRRFPVDRDKQTIDNVFPLSSASKSIDTQFYWEPNFRDEAARRILRQRSVFIVGNSTGPEISPMRVVAAIEIAAEDKAALRDELDRLFGVSQLTLFPDVHGFASANSQSTAISRLFDPDYYTNQGSELYQRGEFRRSIFAFDESIRLRRDLWMAHYLRGNAKAQNGDYDEAKSDYSTALRLLISSTEPTQTAMSYVEYQTALILFNRGNMHYVLGHYEDACVDYSEAIDLCSDAQQGSLRYNRANAKTKVGQFEAALDDYEIAIRLDVGHAVFNKGNALVGLGRFAEALQCYLEESKKHGSQKTENNIAIMREVISRIEDPSRIVCTFDPADKMVGGLPTVTVFRDEAEMVKKHTIGPATGKTFLCTGSAGNVGNYGGGGTEGGEGFDGDNGFGLRITW